MKFFRVTEVFGRYFPNVPERKLAYAGDRGTRAHELCFKRAKNIYIPTKKVDPDTYLYYRSFEQWFELMVMRVLFIEPEFIDATYGFKGHPDMGLVLKNREHVLIDLKTPVAHKKIWAGQCAAYLHLAQRSGHPLMFRSGSLQLNPNGSMARATWYQYHQNDFAAFLSLLQGVRYFND